MNRSPAGLSVTGAAAGAAVVFVDNIRGPSVVRCRDAVPAAAPEAGRPRCGLGRPVPGALRDRGAPVSLGEFAGSVRPDRCRGAVEGQLASFCQPPAADLLAHVPQPASPSLAAA